MSNEAPSRRSAMQVLSRFVILVVVVGLLAAVFWLLSERHARTWAVQQRGRELWIMRGRELPFGYIPFRPTDRVLAQAYAPLVLNADSPGDLLLNSFADRDQLDCALFKTLKDWVEVRLNGDDPERLNQALQLLKRADLLTGIDSEQRRQLKNLQTKVAYFEGRLRLEEADATLREGLARIKVAAEARGRYAREAGELYERISGLSEQITRTLRMPSAGSAILGAKPQHDLERQEASPVPANSAVTSTPEAGDAGPSPAPQPEKPTP